MTTPETSDRPLLDWLLQKFPESPKKRAKQWITAGRVSVDGVVIRKPHHVLPDPGAKLQLLDRHAAVLDCGPGGWQIHPRVNLIYLDSALAIVNKGPGLISTPADPQELTALGILADFLAGKLRAYDRGIAGRSLPPAYRRLEPMPVHRLDQYTSGVFCMALNPAAREKLINQLKLHTMQRQYVAYCEGRLPAKQGTWKNWLRLSEDELRQFVITAEEAKSGKSAVPTRPAIADDDEGDPVRPSTKEAIEAITHYEVIKEFPVERGHGVVTKIRLRLETGRKHQIRVQAAFAGAPLVGDRTYNARRRIEFPRQALHAETLTLEHPEKTGVRMTWTAALPRDLAQLENELRCGRL